MINIKITIRIIHLFLLCIISLTLQLPSIFAQKTQDETAKKKIGNFLNNYKEFQNYSVTGFTATFTGEFQQLPNDIQFDLNRNFPRYRFNVAKMSVLIDAPLKFYNLILITDKNSAEIKGFVWANYRMLHPSDSFPFILQGHSAKSKENAVEQIKSIAGLIAFAGNENIGKAKIKDGKVTVELIRAEGISATLRAKIDKHLQFRHLVITEPDGKEVKYFVSKKQILKTASN